MKLKSQSGLLHITELSAGTSYVSNLLQFHLSLRFAAPEIVDIKNIFKFSSVAILGRFMN